MSSARPGTKAQGEPAPRVLLTGAGGFVGSRIAALAPCLPCPPLRAFTDSQVKQLVEEAAPDLIIHTAAISDIGACEKDPEASYRANVLLPLALAKAAGPAKLLVFSTDQVYSGMQIPGPFREDDTPVPANTYARHKVEMERRVLETAPGAVLLRATWMYDFPLYHHANRGNFLMNVLKAALSGETLAFSDTEYRGLTYVRQVAEFTLKAASLPGGIYNFGSENSLTMLDTARALLEAFHIKGNLAEGSGSRNLWMDGAKLAAQGLAFDSTAEGFARCARDYGFGA